MDVGSGVSVRALGVAAGDHVLDLCAAPGNKMIMLADLLQQREAERQKQKTQQQAFDASAASSAAAAPFSTAPAAPFSRGSVTGVDWSYARLAAARSLARKYGARRVRFCLADGQTFSEPPPSGSQLQGATAGHIIDLTQQQQRDQSSSGESSSHAVSTGDLAFAHTFHSAHAADASSWRPAASSNAAAGDSPTLLRLSKREKRALHKREVREAWNNKKQRLENGSQVFGEAADQSPPAASAVTVTAAPLLYDRVLVDAECTHDGSVKHTQRLQAAAAEAARTKASPESSAADTVGESSSSAVSLSPPADVMSLHAPERLASLQLLQRNLLLRGFRMLRPGGTLLYCTCSLQRVQNEDIVAWLLEQEQEAIAVHAFEGVASSVEAKATAQEEEQARTALSSPARTTDAAAPAFSSNACFSLESPLLSCIEEAQLDEGCPALRYRRVWREIPSAANSDSAPSVPSSLSSQQQQLGVRLDSLVSGTSGLFFAKLLRRAVESP